MNKTYYSELSERINLSFERLSSETYRGEQVFREVGYSWEGDWEGRALLAFVCHKRITGKTIPTLEYEIEHLDEKTNKNRHFGKIFDGQTISEQLLSGNGWYLRALCEYYTDTKDEKILGYIKSIVEKLYLACDELYDNYPSSDRGDGGAVSGVLLGQFNGWILSTDVGCAFIALDGLSAAYKILKDEKLKAFLDKRIKQFLSFDKIKYQMQTHATMTVCRAILRMYLTTGEGWYLEKSRELFDFYVAHGMTLTYENYNWFGRPDTWTEPCAVIDSLIVALYLYRETNDSYYLTFARRIYFNGINLGQRCNGGAGTSDCVTKDKPIWKAQMFEAEFCCTMRTAEGLYHINLFKDILFEQDDDEKEIIKDEHGRHFKGDHLLCRANGQELSKLPIMYKYSADELKEVELKILF